MQKFAIFFFFKYASSQEFSVNLSTLLSVGYILGLKVCFYMKGVGVTEVLKMYTLVLWVFSKDIFSDST